jgi:mRNA-degrading endonuclease RelE of RelBE toxin-antitoxin system
MVTVAYSTLFEKTIRKIKDTALKEHVKAQIIKIINDPMVGKPMRYCRENTREVYLPPFRLSYCYDCQSDLILFLTLYHKDEQ